MNDRELINKGDESSLFLYAVENNNLVEKSNLKYNETNNAYSILKTEINKNENDSTLNVLDRAITIQELQKRLDNRNLLLDIVRKAYHRDVLVVKYQLEVQSSTEKKKIDNVSGNQIDSLSMTSMTSLSSVPSIDLRHEGFHLFSPQECELRLHPCHTCGGHYEVIHRESSRYSALLRCRDDLLEQIRCLEEELSKSKQRVIDGKEKMSLFHESTEKRNVEFTAEIERLTAHAADFDVLKRLCEDQKNKLKVLLGIQEAMEKVEQQKETLHRDLVGEKEQNKFLHTELREMKDQLETLQSEIETGLGKINEKDILIERLQAEKNELKLQLKKKNDSICNLDEDLNNCQNKVKSLQNTLKVTKEDATTKEIGLRANVSLCEKNIEEMTISLKECTQKYQQIKQDLQKEKYDHHQIQVQMKKELQYHEAEAERQTQKDKAEIEALSNRLGYFTTLTSSYIQSLYEQCMVQEEIISLEDKSLLGIHDSHKFYKSSTKNKGEINQIFEKIANRIESIHIDWEGILKNDDDRRAIFGNLNNRSQINNSQIDNLIKRINIKSKSERENIQATHHEAVISLKSNYRTELSSLDRQIIANEKVIGDLNASLEETKNEVSIARANISELNDIKNQNEARIIELEKQVFGLSLHCNEYQNELSMMKSQLHEAISTISFKDDEIDDRDQTLRQLEAILEKTTSRFALKLKEERMRLETNIDREVQVVVPLSDFSQQVDFISLNQKSVDYSNRQQIKANIFSIN